MIPLCQLEWDDGILRSFGEGLPTLTWTRPADLATARLALIDASSDVFIENGKDLLTAAFQVIPFLRGLSPSCSALCTLHSALKNGGLSPSRSALCTLHSALKNGGLSPKFSFGNGVTGVAREAFLEFAAGPNGADDFKVLRGEPDDYLMFFRRIGNVLTVGAISINPGSLTVRLEDVWLATPPAARAFTYRAEVWHDRKPETGNREPGTGNREPFCRQLCTPLTRDCFVACSSLPRNDGSVNREPETRNEELGTRNCNPEILEDVAPDARIFLDVAAAGGFLIRFTPVPEN